MSNTIAGRLEYNVQGLERLLKPYKRPIKDELLKWLYLQLPPERIANKKSHSVYLKVMRIFLKALANDELAPDVARTIRKYIEAISPHIESYEREHIHIGAATPEEVLRFLMEEHQLSRGDLAAEVGGSPIVSDILSGKRQLTRNHIERLSQRFGISPASFYGASA